MHPVHRRRRRREPLQGGRRHTETSSSKACETPWRILLIQFEQWAGRGRGRKFRQHFYYEALEVVKTKDSAHITTSRFAVGTPRAGLIGFVQGGTAGVHVSQSDRPTGLVKQTRCLRPSD